jgi:hypothetical protein
LVESWGYLAINDLQLLGPNRWYDAGDQRFNPDNLMFDSRKANFVATIEKKTEGSSGGSARIFPAVSIPPINDFLTSKCRGRWLRSRNSITLIL